MRRRELISILKAFSLEDVLIFEEKYDEQYKAIKHLAFFQENPDLTNIIVLLNALVSYQLNCFGEDYWWEFSNYFSRVKISSPIEDMISFLKRSSCNKRLLDVKISKLKGSRIIVETIRNNTRKYAEDLLTLWRIIYTSLKMKREAKTVVFSIKMFNYSTRITFGKRFIIPFEIPIPLDSRILKITYSLGVKGNEIEFWHNISKEVGIPPLHLDSLLWVSFRFSKESESINDERVSKLIHYIKRLLKS